MVLAEGAAMPFVRGVAIHFEDLPTRATRMVKLASYCTYK